MLQPLIKNFCFLGGHHTLKHWLKNVEWGGGLENPDDKVKLTFHTQGMGKNLNSKLNNKNFYLELMKYDFIFFFRSF